MTKKFKQKIYFALALVLTLGMAFAYFHSTRVVGGEAHEHHGPGTTFIQLISRDESEVARIVFRADDLYSYMQPFLDENEVLQWSYSPGKEFLLDQNRTRDKARQAWSLTAQGVLHEDSGGLDLSEFWLEPALVTMEITYTDDTAHVVLIGGLTTDLRQRFMKFDDDPRIFLVSAATAGRIMSDVDLLIDLSLPDFSFEMATYFSIWQDGHGHMEFLLPIEKWQETWAYPPGWSMEMVSPVAGFQPNIVNIQSHIVEPLQGFRLLEVRALKPESLEEFGLHEPWLLFEYHTPNEQTFLLFGDTFTEDGDEFIYVKIGARPHVFVALYERMQSLVDINPFIHIVRTLALVNIIDIYALTIVTNYEAFVIYINHDLSDSRVINPTINGVEVDGPAFRTVYQSIIGISADTTVPPFMPAGIPDIIIHYHHFDVEDRSLWLFERDSQFYYVSVDGAYARFVTTRRSVDAMLASLMALMD